MWRIGERGNSSQSYGDWFAYYAFVDTSTPPINGWLSTYNGPAPSLSSTNCAPTTTPAYFVATNAAYGGKYCEDGTFDDGMGNVKPKYRKTGTSFYMYYVETYWRINDIGNLGNGGSNVYGFTSGANTPPTGLSWLDMDRSEEFFVSNSFYSTSTTATIFNTHISFDTYNGKPEYDRGGIKIRYEPSIQSWVIDDLSQDPDNPNRLYQNSSTANTPPLTGWTVVNGSSPAPTLVGPNC
jgi:hypothetical protein